MCGLKWMMAARLLLFALCVHHNVCSVAPCLRWLAPHRPHHAAVRPTGPTLFNHPPTYPCPHLPAATHSFPPAPSNLLSSTHPLSLPAAGGSDLQLAWENLETAKVIWQREGADNNVQQLAGGQTGLWVGGHVASLAGTAGATGSKGSWPACPLCGRAWGRQVHSQGHAGANTRARITPTPPHAQTLAFHLEAPPSRTPPTASQPPCALFPTPTPTPCLPRRARPAG